jgi:ribosomal-protein-alanine N-acetyltransferase
MPGDMVASGPTLTLRYAEPGDAEALLALGSDPEVTRWFSWGPYARVEEPAAYIAGCEPDRRAGRRLDFLIVRAGDGPVGVTGLSELSRRDRRAVVGSWLGRPWWGSGANDEAKALVTRVAFDAVGVERVGAYAATENARSQRALEKLGFVREGTLRRFHRHGERVFDVHVYGLLRADWERSPLAAVPVELRGEPPAAFAL